MSKHTVSAAGGAMPAEGLKTRRAALAVLTGAIASAPALAAAASLAVPVLASPAGPSAVAVAIAAHKAVQGKLDAMKGDGPEFDDMCDVEGDRFCDLAETPCASDAEFFAKATYMIAHVQASWGGCLSDGGAFGLLAVATEAHMQSREGADV
jgi:hypothetical protein